MHEGDGTPAPAPTPGTPRTPKDAGTALPRGRGGGTPRAGGTAPPKGRGELRERGPGGGAPERPAPDTGGGQRPCRATTLPGARGTARTGAREAEPANAPAHGANADKSACGTDEFARR
ncbi:hypothetical protein GCM10018777_17780 [Streptomyces albogriseolus]|nr:hypothetical protein GCM10018777_17780 [Streptomyces viridodiastaticus]